MVSRLLLGRGLLISITKIHLGPWVGEGSKDFFILLNLEGLGGFRSLGAYLQSPIKFLTF